MAAVQAATSARRFPASYRALKTLPAKFAWLAGEECSALVAAGGLVAAQVEREWRRCDDAADKRRTAGVRADRVLNRRTEAHVEWPRQYLSSRNRIVADNDGHEWLVPETSTYDVVCLDDDRRRWDLGLPFGEWSQTSRALRALKEAGEGAGGRFEEAPLPTEDVEVLKRQIARYMAGQKTSLLSISFSENGTPPTLPM